MRKLLALAWITLLSTLSRTADASVSADIFSSKALSPHGSEHAVTGDPIVYSGNGTATCGAVDPMSRSNNDDLWQKQVTEMTTNARTEAEKQMAIDLVISINNPANQ